MHAKSVHGTKAALPSWSAIGSTSLRMAYICMLKQCSREAYLTPCIVPKLIMRTHAPLRCECRPGLCHPHTRTKCLAHQLPPR